MYIEIYKIKLSDDDKTMLENVIRELGPSIPIWHSSILRGILQMGWFPEGGFKDSVLSKYVKLV